MNNIEDMPTLVHQMCVRGALIVGSRANLIMGEDTEADDWDLLILPERFMDIAPLIPAKYSVNKFGGCKFINDDNTMTDVWIGEVQSYLINYKSKKNLTPYVIDYTLNRYYTSGLIT